MFDVEHWKEEQDEHEPLVVVKEDKGKDELPVC